MIDKNFDPYEKLMLCEKNIKELVFAINEMSEHIKNYAVNNEQQAKLLNHLHKQNMQLDQDLKMLKQRLNLVEQKQSN